MKKPTIQRRVSKRRPVPLKHKKSKADSFQQWTSIGASAIAILAGFSAVGMYFKENYTAYQKQLDEQLSGFWTTNTDYCVDCPDSRQQTVNIDLEVSKGEITGRVDVGCMLEAPEKLWEGRKKMSELSDAESTGLMQHVKKHIYTHLEVLGKRPWFSSNARLYVTLVKARKRYLVAEAVFREVSEGSYALEVLSGDLYFPEDKILLSKWGEPFEESPMRACRDSQALEDY